MRRPQLAQRWQVKPLENQAAVLLALKEVSSVQSFSGGKQHDAHRLAHAAGDCHLCLKTHILMPTILSYLRNLPA